MNKETFHAAFLSTMLIFALMLILSFSSFGFAYFRDMLIFEPMLIFARVRYVIMLRTVYFGWICTKTNLKLRYFVHETDLAMFITLYLTVCKQISYNSVSQANLITKKNLFLDSTMTTTISIHQGVSLYFSMIPLWTTEMELILFPNQNTVENVSNNSLKVAWFSTAWSLF